MKSFNILNRDELFLIAKELSLIDLMNFCASSKKVNDLICLRNEIWNYKINHEFPILSENKEMLRMSAKDIYILTIFKEKYNLQDVYASYLTNKMNIIFHTFREFPEEITYLTNLKELSLSGNFPSVPKEIGNLTNLTNLSLSFSSIKRLPKEIGNLIGLKELYLGRNEIHELPKEIGNLKKLEIFMIFSNLLKTLPKEIGNLKKLRQLNLSENKIQYLPKEIGKLTKLEYLSIYSNKIKYFPQEFQKLISLTYLEYKGIDTKHIKDLKRNLPKLKCKLVNS